MDIYLCQVVCAIYLLKCTVWIVKTLMLGGSVRAGQTLNYFGYNRDTQTWSVFSHSSYWTLYNYDMNAMACIINDQILYTFGGAAGGNLANVGDNNGNGRDGNNIISYHNISDYNAPFLVNDYSLWNRIPQDIPQPGGYWRVVSVGDLIYIISGWDFTLPITDTRSFSDVQILDTKTGIITGRSDGVENLPIILRDSACHYNTIRYTINCFGGIDDPGTINNNIYSDKWIFSNSLSSDAPTFNPTPNSLSPSISPTSSNPTIAPTQIPTKAPTIIPTINPAVSPTQNPTMLPSSTPTTIPTTNPTVHPTTLPTENPTILPSSTPTTNPTLFPTQYPSVSPSTIPTSVPTLNPTNVPSINPNINPTLHPTISPSNIPTKTPTNVPTINPTTSPSDPLSISTSNSPSINPTNASIIANNSINTIATQYPTLNPTKTPFIQPTTKKSLDRMTIILIIIGITSLCIVIIVFYLGTKIYYRSNKIRIMSDSDKYTIRPHSEIIDESLQLTTQRTENDPDKYEPVIKGILTTKKQNTFETLPEQPEIPDMITPNDNIDGQRTTSFGFVSTNNTNIFDEGMDDSDIETNDLKQKELSFKAYFTSIFNGVLLEYYDTIVSNKINDIDMLILLDNVDDLNDYNITNKFHQKKIHCNYRSNKN